MGGVPKTSGPEQGTLPFVDLNDELSSCFVSSCVAWVCALRWRYDSGGAGRRSWAVGGVRGGDVRAAEQVRSAEQGQHVCARVAAVRAAQVDAADGRTAGCG